MKRPSLFFSLVVAIAALHSTAWAQQKRSDDPLSSQAYKAGEEGKFAEAMALYDSLVQKYPAQTQDDVSFLLAASQYAALAGNKDRAFALCESALQVPVELGAHPPSLAGGPVDLRGEVRWQMAQIRRSQGRWSEALALYQLNRRTYPRDDGCVPSGRAFQEMAMVEGECLEHLGRFDEAVALYFPAALYASSLVTPEAMRRLFDLYQRANQLQDLERNMMREKAIYDKKMEEKKEEWEKTGMRNDLSEEDWVLGAFTIFGRVRRSRDMARLHRWNELVEILHEADDKLQENGGRLSPWDAPELNIREVTATLLTLDTTARAEALHALEEFAKRNLVGENDYPRINTRALILILGGHDADDEVTRHVESRRDELLGHTTYVNREFAPRQPAPLPTTLKLPVVLSTELTD